LLPLSLSLPHFTPPYSRAVFLAFERCVTLREDLNKTEKKSLVDEGTKLLRDFGQPPEEGDDDALMSLGGALGAGVMHGASMSQGASWSTAQVTATI
jgi:hypothetical protein